MDNVILISAPIVILFALFALYDWWQDKKHSKQENTTTTKV